MTMLKLALKGAWSRKLRLLMLLGIVMASVGFIVGTYVFTDTIKSGFSDVFGTVYKDTSAVVRGEKIAGNTDDFDFGGRGLVPASALDKVAATPGVVGAEGVLVIFLSVLDDNAKVIETGPPTFGYAWNDTPGANPYVMAEGNSPAAPNEVVINRLLAKRGKFTVGETIKVVAGDKPEDFLVSGIATFGKSDGSTLAMLFAPVTAQRLSGYPPGQYNEAWAVGAAGSSQEEIRDAVKASLAGEARLEVVTGREITAETQKVFQDFIDSLAKFLLAFGLLSLVVGVFVIYNTFSILIAQRQREVALLRAVGASGSQVRRSVLIEASALGIIGSVLGIGFGLMMALGLRALFAAFGANPPGSSLEILPRTVVIGAGAGILATVLSAYFPARRASKVPPVAAIRDAALDTTGKSRGRALAGAATVAGGLAMLVLGLAIGKIEVVGFAFLTVIIGIAIVGPVLVKPLIGTLGSPLPKLRGTTGLLARENAVRNPRRTASSALALTIGVAVVAFFLVVGQSVKASVAELVDNQFRADLIVRNTSNGQPVGLTPELTAKLSQIGGLGDTTALRFGTIAIDGRSKPVIAANPATVDALFDFGAIGGRLSDLTGDSIAVKLETAVKNGWSVNTVLKGRAESGPVDLKIVATFEKNDAVGSNYMVGLSTLSTHSPSITQDVALVVKIKDGADATVVRAAFDNALKDYPTLKVQDRSEFKESQSAQVNQILTLVTMLLSLAIVIALLGIAITLSLSVFERRRELGILRAIGQQRRQTRSTVRWEAILIAVLGTLLGLVVGTVFGVAIVKSADAEAFNTISVPVGGLITVAVISAIAGVVAAWWPARRAAKTDIMVAIASS